jgi:prophage regulatory protein
MKRIDLPQLIGAEEVRRVTSLSRSTLERKVRAGSFPAPRRIVGRKLAWKASEVAAWINGDWSPADARVDPYASGRVGA